jgi:4-hydroxybenzoate polyprenyltransferase
MHLDKTVIRWNAIAFGILGLLSLAFGLTGLGAMSIIFAVVNIIASLIYLLMKDYHKLKTSLLICGLLFLIGFGLCSSFPLNFH